ncbi:aceric acid hydrolase [Sphingobacterium corticibacterium]|uniref:Glycoside hydrolase family 127 protein n=1 Tax=Sphingobacterium corticibacterium TaxID=2484746 RepID=A0A4Q6XSV7_9SPHI|nr:beta-L-arabinofuranosidase domain-containing protein [Sphingobacterium corticibacterium]RZF59839.1 glycoside hydrolase family 127 protein [Sphingobacterium corticibacterium]
MKAKNSLFILALSGLLTGQLHAQEKAITNTGESPFAIQNAVNMGDVSWTKGFWAERTSVCYERMVPHLWDVYTSAEISHAYRNFEIAAGLAEGEHKGPSFHDGDFYKTLEAVCALYAQTKDERLLQMIDEVTPVIAKSQREDGYIYTKATIDQRNSGENIEFQDRLSFEAYNIGHLMTAGCIHYRVTGNRNLLKIAIKAADYLYGFYKKSNPTLARNAICPSHYMGTIELYRTTKDPKYLELAQHLIDIKGEIEDGTDDNQDRIPFRQQNKAMGHAVRASYLYAGVTDLVTEIQDTTLSNRLFAIWDDVVKHKMYITGGLGSLYDGTSPDGTSYNPTDVQKIHQAFGRDYQLPNLTAHNETCANIGNMLWNWRMAAFTGDAKYIDVLELALYNSVLSGISLDGDKFLYTNPLSYSSNLPFQQRWSKKRVPYISLSNCCPPNVVRTIAEVSSYAYSVSDDAVWVNLFGGNVLDTEYKGQKIKITQESNYPWDGDASFVMEELPTNYALKVRIPGWAEGAEITKNNEKIAFQTENGYAVLSSGLKKGDRITLHLPMNVTFMEANPLVEEARNQVAVMRGPVVYCLEKADVPENADVFDLKINASSSFEPVVESVLGQPIVFLQGNAYTDNTEKWNALYRKVSADEQEAVSVRLVPYFAWGNRTFGDMAVWLPRK